MSAPTRTSGFFQILPSTDNVIHVFVYLQRAKSNNDGANPYEYKCMILLELTLIVEMALL